MGRQARKPRREEILLEMRRLSEARVNDAVRLAYAVGAVVVLAGLITTPAIRGEGNGGHSGSKRAKARAAKGGRSR